MNEHHLPVRRTARFHSIGNPDTSDVWIVCHGYAQLARYFLRAFAAIDDGSRYIIAPEALNRYYYETSPGVHASDARIAATWMTREDREADIADYVAYLESLAEHVTGGGSQRITALGFSQGASTVSRWAARGRTRIDDVVLWGSPLAPELDASATLLRGARLMVAIGDQDGQIPAGEVERQDARLRSGGMDYDLIRYAGGHRIEADALVDIASRIRDRQTARRQ